MGKASLHVNLKHSNVATLTQIYQLKMMEWSNHPDTTHNSIREGLREVHSSGFFLQTLCVYASIYKSHNALSVIISNISKEKSMRYSLLNTKISLCVLGFVSLFTHY